MTTPRVLLPFALMLLLATSALADVEQQLQRFDQAPRDSLAEQANGFFRQLCDEQFLDTLYIYNSATPADTLREQVWYWAAEYYYDQQRYDQADAYALQALPLFRQGNDRTGEADCLNLLAIANVRLGHYQRAATFAKQCHQLDEDSGDADRQAASLNLLAAIYLSANQGHEAVKYVLRGIDKATQANDRPRLATLLGTASEIYHAIDDDQRSLTYANQAYEMEQQLGREYKAMIRLSQKASALTGLGQYDEARQELEKAIAYFRQVNDRQSIGICCYKMGMVRLRLGEAESGVPFFREAVDIFRQIGDRGHEMYAHRGLYECLWKTDPDSAKIENELFSDLKDSLYNNASAESLARFNAEFENDWLIRENHAEQAARKRVVCVAVLALAALLVLVGVGAWLMRRRQQRISEQLRANLQKYDELSQRYKALQTTAADTPTGAPQLTQGDQQFLDRLATTAERLLQEGHLDAETTAAEMGMSLYQLRQRLSTITGDTPQLFIATMRMRHARHLLDEHPQMTVGEVAMACGYGDTPNFTRAFKKTFGLTPTQYVAKKGASAPNDNII